HPPVLTSGNLWRPDRALLFCTEGVAKSGGELKRVLFEAWWRVIQKGVRHARTETELLIERDGKYHAAIGGICAGEVPCGIDGKFLPERCAAQKFLTEIL